MKIAFAILGLIGGVVGCLLLLAWVAFRGHDDTPYLTSEHRRLIDSAGGLEYCDPIDAYRERLRAEDYA